MTDATFDAYHKWLGIPPAEQPPSHYRLLGLAAFEADGDVIDAAANRQMAFLQTCANGPHAADSQRLLTEVAAARLVLLGGKRDAYDATLRAAVPASVGAPAPVGSLAVVTPLVRKLAASPRVVAVAEVAEDDTDAHRPRRRDRLNPPVRQVRPAGESEEPTAGRSWGPGRSKRPAKASRLRLLIGGAVLAALIVAGSAVVVSGLLRSRSSPPLAPVPAAEQSGSAAPGPKTVESPVEQTPSVRAEGRRATVLEPAWTPLLNGRNLDGWVTVALGKVAAEDATRSWAWDAASNAVVSDGSAHSELQTTLTYKDFGLRFQWRFRPGGPAGPNGSGVMVRCRGIDPVMNYDPRGVEIDFRPTADPAQQLGSGCFFVYGTTLTNHRGGTDGRQGRSLGWIQEPPPMAPSEWNDCEVTCQGDRISVSMNGVKANEGWGAEDVAGRISLRSQKTAVEFRQVEVKELPRTSTALASDDVLLQGEWVCTHEEFAGKAISAAELEKMNKTLTVSGDKFMIERSNSFGRGKYDGEVKLTPTTDPRLFDFYGDGPGGSKVWFFGLYELTADEFKVCYSWAATPEDRSQRATDFRTREGVPLVMNTFKRVASPRPVARGQPSPPHSEVTAAVEVRRFEGHKDMVWSVAVSPDGRRAASGSGGGRDGGGFSAAAEMSLRFWDVTSGRELKKFTDFNAWVTAVAYSPNGIHLAAGSSDSTLRLYDMRDMTRVKSFLGHAAPVQVLAFSPDGNFLLSGGGNGTDFTARLWKVASAQVVHEFTGHTAGVWGVAFSSDGGRVATSSRDGTVRLWDAGTGRQVRSFDGAGGRGGIAFLPGGRRLACGCGDDVYLLDAAGDSKPQAFKGHKGEVLSVAVSPDGKRLLSGGRDNLAILWDVETGAKVCELRGHADWVFSVVFSADGRQACSGSADKTMRLWRLPPAAGDPAGAASPAPAAPPRPDPPAKKDWVSLDPLPAWRNASGAWKLDGQAADALPDTTGKWKVRLLDRTFTTYRAKVAIRTRAKGDGWAAFGFGDQPHNKRHLLFLEHDRIKLQRYDPAGPNAVSVTELNSLSMPAAGKTAPWVYLLFERDEGQVHTSWSLDNSKFKPLFTVKLDENAPPDLIGYNVQEGTAKGGFRLLKLESRD